MSKSLNLNLTDLPLLPTDDGTWEFILLEPPAPPVTAVTGVREPILLLLLFVAEGLVESCMFMVSDDYVAVVRQKFEVDFPFLAIIRTTENKSSKTKTFGIFIF